MLTILSTVRAIVAVLVLAAIGQQFLLHIKASYSALNFFSYFTNLSNLFAAFVLLAIVIVRRSRTTPAGDGARFTAAVNMAVVGIVFSVLLRDVDLGDLLPWVNFVLHYLMPVVVVLDWLVQPPGSRLKSGHLFLASIFPATYLVYVLLRGASTGWYPYPFLNPTNVGGYSGVALYAAGILLVFLVTGCALLAVGNLRQRPESGVRENG